MAWKFLDEPIDYKTCSLWKLAFYVLIRRSLLEYMIWIRGMPRNEISWVFNRADELAEKYPGLDARQVTDIINREANERNW